MPDVRPLRELFDDLAQRQPQDAPEQVPALSELLREAGHGDLPVELVAEALAGYAGTAPLPVAEQLSTFSATWSTGSGNGAPLDVGALLDEGVAGLSRLPDDAADADESAESVAWESTDPWLAAQTDPDRLDGDLDALDGPPGGGESATADPAPGQDLAAEPGLLQTADGSTLPGSEHTEELTEFGVGDAAAESVRDEVTEPATDPGSTLDDAILDPALEDDDAALDPAQPLDPALADGPPLDPFAAEPIPDGESSASDDSLDG